MHVVVDVNNDQVDVILAGLRVNNYVILYNAVSIYILCNVDVKLTYAYLVVGVDVQDSGLASLDLVLGAQVSSSILEGDSASALVVRSDLGLCVVLANRSARVVLALQNSQINSAIGVVSVLECFALADGYVILRLEG